MVPILAEIRSVAKVRKAPEDKPTAPPAKGRGRPSTGRNDAPVKMERALTTMAKAIADAKGITVAEVVSDLIRAPMNRAYNQMLEETKLKGAEG